MDPVTGNATIVAPEVPRGYLLNLSVTHADPLRPMALSPEGGCFCPMTAAQPGVRC